MNIITEYPLWFTVFCLAAAAGCSAVLYFRDRHFGEVSRIVLTFMAVLRFLSFFLIAFLLLSPLLKQINREVEKPVIIVAQDNSVSIVTGKDSSFYRKEYKEKLRKLIADLGDKYEVRSYAFGDKVTDLNSVDSLNFDRRETDMSELFDQLQTRYSNRNVGAVIIAGDGLFNRGQNPLYASEVLNAPVYTIALGDTTVRKDLILNRVGHNRIAYLGNDFPLEINVNAHDLKGKITTLKVLKGDATLFTQTLNLNSDAWSASVPVMLNAKEPGMQHYRVTLSAVAGEMTLANNSTDVYINVLDARQKVLILSQSPHPDVAALKLSIGSSQNYEVESYTIDQFDKNPSAYSLVILHQLSAQQPVVAKLLASLRSAGTSVWAFSGANAVLKDNLTLQNMSARTNECEPVFEENFPLFTVSEELRKEFRDLPAVACPFGNYQANAASNVLLYQRIGIVDTKTPMMYFTSSPDNKIAVFNGEGIWKWRLQDFEAHGSSALFDEFVSKTVQYLSVKADKSFFRVTGKNNFAENEPVQLDAEVYNQSYELINAPEVTIAISDASGKKFPFTFSRTTNAYRLNAGIMKPGEYKYAAQVKVGDKIYTQNGQFSVSALQVELTNMVADHRLMFALAGKHGGEMVYPSDMESLTGKLNAREDIRSVSYSEKRLTDMINLKWIFFLVLLLLALEWVMRRRNGSY